MKKNTVGRQKENLDWLIEGWHKNRCGETRIKCLDQQSEILGNWPWDDVQ